MIYWIVSVVLLYFVIISFGILVLGLKYDAANTSFTNLYSFAAIWLCVYLATKSTKKYRIKKYSNWLIVNIEDNDPDLKSILYHLMNMKVLDQAIISCSNLANEYKNYFIDFEYNPNNRVDALKIKYKNVKIIDDGLVVLPYNYAFGYMTISLIANITISIIIIYIVFSFIGSKEGVINYVVIFTLFVIGVLAFLSVKTAGPFTRKFKNKEIINIGKSGIEYDSKFYRWENIELSHDFITNFENFNPRDFFIDLTFKHKEDTTHLNFKTMMIIEIYYYFLYYSNHTIITIN